ncbi:MAG: ribulose-phosphate 3-epimerase [Christensenellales bacterium]
MKVSVSSLPYNNNIMEALAQIISSGADFLHLDIMDGTLTDFVTFDFCKVKEINDNSTFVLDCHLMANEPKNLVKKYVQSGVNILTVHFEAFKNVEDLISTLSYLKDKKVVVGLSVYPRTKLEKIEPLQNLFDLLLIMSVEIGKYGQKFIESSVDKIVLAKKMFPNKLIEVDGGVNLTNVEAIKQAGADIVVVGGAFKNAQDKNKLVALLKA